MRMPGHITLYIIRCEAGDLGEASQHARANFVAVVKGKHDIGLTASLEHSMGTGCSFNPPADAEKSGENTRGLG